MLVITGVSSIVTRSFQSILYTVIVHQRQTDAAAAHRVAALVELGLDVLEVFGRDAAALVDKFDKGFVLARPELDCDAPAGGGILDLSLIHIFCITSSARLSLTS